MVRLIIGLFGIAVILAGYVVALFSEGEEANANGYVKEPIDMNHPVSYIVWGALMVLGTYAIHLFTKNIVINEKKKQIDS